MIYSIDKRESARITCLRAICAVLVIFLHQYAGDLGSTAFSASGTVPENEVLRSVQYIISRIITFSAVPLFFVTSSMLLYCKEFTWKDNMKKKAKSLLLPYILWITLYILVYYVGQSMPITRAFFANSSRKVSDMSIADFIGAYTGICGNGLFVNALWFVRDLTILNILAPFIKKLIDRIPFLYFVLIMVLWNMGSIPKFFVLNAQSVVFFSLGYYIVKYNCRMKQIDKLSIRDVFVIYALTIGLEFYFYRIGNQLQTAAHSFSSIIGIVILVRLSALICEENGRIPKLLKKIAEHSFFVYASHDFVQTLFKKVTNKAFLQTDAIQMIEYVFIPVMVCAVCICTAEILRKLLLPVYSVLTGARKQRT